MSRVGMLELCWISSVRAFWGGFVSCRVGIVHGANGMISTVEDRFTDTGR